MENEKRVYFASPLGFNTMHKDLMEKIEQVLVSQGCKVFNPWKLEEVDQLIAAIADIKDYETKLQAHRTICSKIGTINAQGIEWANIVFGVLDGTEPDSGTVGEIAFGSALDKMCYALRTDIRDAGEFPGVPLNLQVLYFIERTGGKLFRSLEEINIQ